jgi:hypothetical protein
MTEAKPDMRCVPYQRKGLYLALTIPMLLILLGVFVYLWTFSFLLALAFLACYVWMSTFQAYCCAYQKCPYVGGFCPAVLGIMPASLIAKVLYGSREIKASKARFETIAAVAVLGWLGLVFLPVYWIAQVHIGLAIGYVVLHAVYAVIFGLTVCPVCAIRETCPGGKFHVLVRRVAHRES